VVAFTSYVFVLPHLLQKIGSVWTVVATFYVGWQLHRRASAVPPERAGEMPIYLFLRGQFVRQRDALRAIFWWYILPFIPGLVLVTIGNWFDPDYGKSAPTEARVLVSGSLVAVVALIWWLNQRGARRLQRKIDEIDALTGGNE